MFLGKTINERFLQTSSQSPREVGWYTRSSDLLSLLVTCDATSTKLAAVTHVANIRHIHIFSSLFLDDKSHFHIALWSLAFCASSEENR